MDEGDLVFFTIIRVDGHLEEEEVLVHLTHVQFADLVGGGVEAELECLFGMDRVFVTLEAIAVEVVRHVPVVGSKGWFEVDMKVEEVDVDGCEFDRIERLARTLLCCGKSGVVPVVTLSLTLFLRWAGGRGWWRSALVGWGTPDERHDSFCRCCCVCVVR